MVFLHKVVKTCLLPRNNEYQRSKREERVLWSAFSARWTIRANDDGAGARFKSANHLGTNFVLVRVRQIN